MQTLPSSSCSSSLLWTVLLIDMNLKNFPKSLDSKTSCLRITIPDNLDLALEGLIRKVLKEQPKIDEIYAFAAEYFDMLLKIRDKVGLNFAGNQHCPFHSDEDAHEMIKLASVFAKPEISKNKMPELEITKNSDKKTRKKKPSRSTEETEKNVQNVKQPVKIQKKPERLAKEKKDGNLHEAKPEGEKQLKLEPKTEDVGDEEEFLKSDSIKLLVEQELMNAAKPGAEGKAKETKNDTNAKEFGKLEEPTENEELCSVIDKDHVKTEIIGTDEIVSNENETENTTEGKKEYAKRKEEGSEVEKGEIKIYDTEKDEAQEEGITEELNSKNSSTAKAEIQENTFEIQNENAHVKSIESLAAEKEIQKPVANETEAEAEIKDIPYSEISLETPKEISEEQNIPKGNSFEDLRELDTQKEQKVQEETQDAVINEINESSSAKEVSLNPDEMCTVVDILSIKPEEKDEYNAEQVKEDRAFETEFKKEEVINELKIKTDEDEEHKKSENSAFEKTIESTLATKAEEANIEISSNENEVPEENEKITPLKVKINEGSANSVEKFQMQINSEDDKSDIKTTMKERKVEETKPVPSGDQKSTENDLQGMQNNDAAQTSTITGDDLASEDFKTTIENENDKDVEEQLGFTENPNKLLENEEHHVTAEKAETAKGSETPPENGDNKFEESSEVLEEELQQIKTEIKAEELIQNFEKTENNELEKADSVTNDQQSSEDTNVIKEERTSLTEFTMQPEVEVEWEKNELKPKEEMKNINEIEGKIQVTEEGENNTKPKEKDDVTEFSEKTDTGDNAESAEEIFLKDSEREKLLNVKELIKTSDEPEKAETLKIDLESTNLANETAKNFSEDRNKTMAGDEPRAEIDPQQFIKIEEAESLPEESPYAEGVQIKTIQTHYYDTLQVPEKLTKEYKVYPVKNGSAIDSSLNITNFILSSDKRQLTEISAPLLDLPQQDDDEQYKKDLEESLLTPSSSSSLNVSELSIQTISEMFLNSEREYSAREAEKRKYLDETGDECGDESPKEKREVEQIIHKTIVPPPVRATPVAPRDDAEIKEEANVEGSLKDENKHEPSADSEERADSSNGGRSADSDTPFISVEVKTLIETQDLEDKEEGKDGNGPEEMGESAVQIRIEATVDVPDGVVVNVREEKRGKDEVRQQASNESPILETVPKNSQTSSAESDSTVSSTATEIKRYDSTKRRFSSTRTLIATQSLDLDKRNSLLKTRSLSSFRQGVIDFEVWNTIEKELEEAATKIQSNFRGYKTRKKLQRENAVHITTEESSSSITPVEQELKEERQQSTGEFHDSIVLSEHPR